MKKKIFISNTIMVLMALLILFSVGSVCVLLFKGEIMQVIQQNAKLSDHVYEVQGILDGMGSDDNWAAGDKAGSDENSNVGNDIAHEENYWEQLADKLSQYNYELYVSDQDKNKIYSNLKHREHECIEEMENTDIPENELKLYNMENVTIVAYTFDASDGSKSEIYHVYAACYDQENYIHGIDRGIVEMFFIAFIVAGTVVIIGLLLCSQAFTKLMIKRIMEPVDELNDAANRVNAGNFDEPVVYDKNDEFAEVCTTFNNMQAHLKENIEKTKEYERARTEMVSGISHDLRTPLTSVKGFIKGMLDGVANTPEKQKKYLEISYRKACDMEVLLQKLFFFSKLETGNMPFFRQDVDMKSWLQKYVDDKNADEEVERKYHLSLYTEADKGCDKVQQYEDTGNSGNMLQKCAEYSVSIDPAQMKRVMDNLLENSIKYSRAEALEISITLTATDKAVTIRFKDNGVGVDEDKLPHVFEQFYRGDESRNSKNDGSGLGLYVCKYIVEQQDGTISACNDNGFCVEMTYGKNSDSRG
ncbi:HAMP domain-containing sensor histidine kinase [Agathobacter sp.]